MPVGLAPVIKSFGIKGLLQVSMLDWPGKVAAVLFTGGCNFRCPFCHNPDLVLKADEIEDIDWAEVEGHLLSKAGWLDGVCITGGEPALNPYIKGIAARVKDLGLQVKLDTNGSKPDLLLALIGAGLIDYVAMDIKTRFEKYGLVSKSKLAARKVEESIRLLTDAEKRGSMELEFRTTFVPGIVEREDVIEIAKVLSKAGGTKFTIQQFNPRKVLEAKASRIRPASKDYLEDLAVECSDSVPTTVR